MKDKLSILLQQKEQIFHTQDLSILWRISNKNTLYTTLKRYCHDGVLFPIHKGLYATVPLEKLDPHVLGIKAIHGFTYITCETILAQHGLLNHIPSEITFASAKSLCFTIGKYRYRSRKLQDKFLFQPFGIFKEKGILAATKERAIADMLYFHPKIHFDGRIDWEEIKKVQQIIKYPTTPKRYAYSSN